MPEDNQAIEEQATEPSVEEEQAEDTPGVEEPQQLSDINDIIASLPEEQQEIVKKNVLMQQDYTRKTQTLAEQRKMIEKMQMDHKDKIDFYDRFSKDAEFRQQVARELGFKAPKTEAGINKKALELLESMPKEEKETIDYIVQQNIEKALAPYKKFIDESKQSRKKSRIEKVTEIYNTFVNDHPDFSEVDQAMKEEAINLGIDFNKLPTNKIKGALNTLYKAVTADRMINTGKAKATKEIIKRTKVAAKNAKKSNNKPSPTVEKETGSYDSIDEAFNAVFEK